jgi:hypothetical protein
LITTFPATIKQKLSNELAHDVLGGKNETKRKKTKEKKREKERSRKSLSPPVACWSCCTAVSMFDGVDAVGSGGQKLMAARCGSPEFLVTGFGQRNSRER